MLDHACRLIKEELRWRLEGISQILFLADCCLLQEPVLDTPQERAVPWSWLEKPAVLAKPSPAGSR